MTAMYMPYNPSGTCIRCKTENVETWYLVCQQCTMKEEDEFEEVIDPSLKKTISDVLNN